MPHQPTTPRPVPQPPAAEPPAPAKKPDLTINKVLAGAGAAATTAIFGSFFGALGTVLGAALGSIASTLATTLYQHSLDRTKETVAARLRSNRTTDPDATVIMPAPRPPVDDATVVLRPQPPAPRRRPRWVVWVGATAAVFVLGLAVVTGIEAIKGSTLVRGESGTSVGRVLERGPSQPTPTVAPEPSGTTTTPEPTTEPTNTVAPSAESAPSSTPNAGEELGTDGQDRSSRTTAGPTPAPTRTPTGG